MEREGEGRREVGRGRKEREGKEWKEGGEGMRHRRKRGGDER